MKPITNQSKLPQIRFPKLIQTNPLKALSLALLAALPLAASASSIGILGADVLLADASFPAVFDWPRASLLAAGVIALVCARASTTKAGDGVDNANSSNF